MHKNCLVQVNYLVQCHLKILLHVFTVCVHSCTYADAYFYGYLEVRGQLARVNFFPFYHVELRPSGLSASAFYH